MYKITAHIKRLLIENDKVIVPGLGTFKLDYSPASIKNEQFVPPTKQLYFDNTPYPNDGLLVRSILKSEQSDYVSANSLIEKEVLSLKKEIENSSTKSVLLEGLGELQQTPSGYLRLKAANVFPFFIDGYGYEPISLQPVLSSRQKSEKENLPIKDVRIEISLRKDFIHKIATIAAILLLILIFPTKIENGNVSTNYAGLIPPIINTQEIPHQEITENDIFSGQQENTEQQQATTTQTAAQKQYHIIISSLPSREAAQIQIKRFSQNGIDSLSTIERDNKIRLSIRHFNTLDEATVYLSELKETRPELSDAWILTVR